MSNNSLVHPYVLVIGASGVDSKARAKISLAQGTSTPGTVLVSAGGVARNVADNLARLGVEVMLLSAVGDDRSGERVLHSAADVGVNTEHMIISDDYHTSAYVAILDDKANLVMSVYDMDILAAITPQVIEKWRDLIKEADFVFVDSNLSEAALAELFRLADRYEVPVCADPTSAALVYKIKPHLASLYMITPNQPEAEILSERTIRDENDAMAAARYLVNQGVDIAVITLAELGIVYASTGDSGHIPSMKIDIVDKTGASDALTATIMFGLLNDMQLDEAVRLGGTAAALTLGCTDTVCVDLSLELLYDQLML